MTRTRPSTVLALTGLALALLTAVLGFSNVVGFAAFMALLLTVALVMFVALWCELAGR